MDEEEDSLLPCSALLLGSHRESIPAVGNSQENEHTHLLGGGGRGVLIPYYTTTYYCVLWSGATNMYAYMHVNTFTYKDDT